MLASLRSRRVISEVSVERIRQRVCRRIPFDRREDARGNATFWAEHTTHLPQRTEPVLEELQPELAYDDPEFAVGERERERAALDTLDRSTIRDRRRSGARDVEHPPVQVEPDDAPTPADMSCSDACDNACAARKVEHRSPRARPTRWMRSSAHGNVTAGTRRRS
jgi:hypothetical protein